MTAYHTVEASPEQLQPAVFALRHGQIDLVPLGSPKTAWVLLRALGDDASRRTGSDARRSDWSTTARALRDANIRVDVIAEQPSFELLIEAGGQEGSALARLTWRRCRRRAECRAVPARGCLAPDARAVPSTDAASVCDDASSLWLGASVLALTSLGRDLRRQLSTDARQLPTQPIALGEHLSEPLLKL